MRERLKTLQRILAVYETIEELCEVEAKRTAGEVRQVQQAIGREKGVVREAASEQHEALADGDRLEWSYAALHQEVASARRIRLERVLLEREKRSATARHSQMTSRQWSKQIKRLVSGVQADIAEQDDRREQSAADDHYLARRIWRLR